MSKLHDFLVEHAKFPFSVTEENRTVAITDISVVEVGLLETKWKANYAVRDDDLVEKLCNTLKSTLGDTLLDAESTERLLAGFLQVDSQVRESAVWRRNQNEAQSRVLLDRGLLQAAEKFLWEYGQHDFTYDVEHTVEGGNSRVDYVTLVNGKQAALLEAKPPTVMKKAGESLPLHGIHLTWVPGQTFMPKLLSKAALYLGLRKMEWLFLTCHNYWIVCRLVKDDHHPFLAYSQKISIEDSSEPFRAYLGAILSVVESVPVESSVFNPDMGLDTITESKEREEDSGPEDNGDNSGDYVGSSKGTVTHLPESAGHESSESGLMMTSSSPNSPESFQVWVHLRPFPNNTLALPQCVKNEKQRLWLTRLIGAGSTGNVWQCHFDHSNDSFAVKVVEMLRSADADSRQRLRNEFNVYLTLEKAYQFGQCVQIAPHCYGAFKNRYIDCLVLDLCDSGTLND